ncbi:MAG: hypothetical protein LLF89_04715, partial [Spirochaetaceae bacterium]|nr:hypothetical protein [Spirochaetaceae bacterium]
EERRTTIFVTHDLHDALYMADSIIVLSARPARIIDTVSIGQARSDRSYDGHDLSAIKQRLYRQILADD